MNLQPASNKGHVVFQELLFWWRLRTFVTKVLKFFIQKFCAKGLNLMHLHFMIISEGAKLPPKSSWQADASD